MIRQRKETLSGGGPRLQRKASVPCLGNLLSEGGVQVLRCKAYRTEKVIKGVGFQAEGIPVQSEERMIPPRDPRDLSQTV